MFKLNPIIIFTVAFLLYGCASEYNLATKKQELIYYTTDKEINIGQAVVKQVEREYKLVEEPGAQKRVRDIGQKIVDVCDRKELIYYFKVLDEKELNAFSLPGGFIYINKGLIDKMTSDDELAGVLAHEVGHVVAKHAVKKLQAMMGYMLARLAGATTGGGDMVQGMDIAFASILVGYSREDELLADRLAIRYMQAAGYDPFKMVYFMQRIYKLDQKKLRPYSYFRTHPSTSDRIRVMREELGLGMDFKDYINIETEGRI
ncbi:MAG: M48 family metallopeptidase [Candidatus Omnitrophota bacterium]